MGGGKQFESVAGDQCRARIRHREGSTISDRATAGNLVSNAAGLHFHHGQAAVGQSQIVAQSQSHPCRGGGGSGNKVAAGLNRDRTGYCPAAAQGGIAIHHQGTGAHIVAVHQQRATANRGGAVVGVRAVQSQVVGSLLG